MSEFHGVLGEYLRPQDAVAAARAVRSAGFSRVEACTPFPVEDLEEALALPRPRLPAIVFAAGALGCVGALAFQAWAAAVDLPLDVGGRPPASWPSFVPVTFEIAILCAALAAVIGFFASCGLPRPYHPLFHVAAFDRATRDRFFLCIEAADPKFDLDRARRVLDSAGAVSVVEVPL